MLTPSYDIKSPSAPPIVEKALYDFIVAYGVPAMDANNVRIGWEARSTLPAGTNDFAIITPGQAERTITSTERLVDTGADPDVGELYEVRSYYSILSQIDFCSSTDIARQRVYSVDAIFRSLVGTNFFSKYGITAQYADNILESTYTDETEDFVRRYTLTLHFAYWAGVDVESSWFNSATIERFENVEVHHPPTES